jgi:hypothetical protein
MLETSNPTKKAKGIAKPIEPFDNPVIFRKILDLLEPCSNQPE